MWLSWLWALYGCLGFVASWLCGCWLCIWLSWLCWALYMAVLALVGFVLLYMAVLALAVGFVAVGFVYGCLGFVGFVGCLGFVVGFVYSQQLLHMTVPPCVSLEQNISTVVPRRVGCPGSTKQGCFEAGVLNVANFNFFGLDRKFISTHTPVSLNRRLLYIASGVQRICQ